MSTSEDEALEDEQFWACSAGLDTRFSVRGAGLPDRAERIGCIEGARQALVLRDVQRQSSSWKWRSLNWLSYCRFGWSN
jgi:hypothetical protein